MSRSGVAVSAVRIRSLYPTLPEPWTWGTSRYATPTAFSICFVSFCRVVQ
jgi:hypothetical protein